MTTESRPPIQESADGVSLRELLGALFDRKWWVASITTVSVAIALLYVLLATPIYRADAIVQVESKVPSLPGLADVSQSLGLGTRSTEATAG
ncbi:Tyrosine-protein kinase etk [compost metagenome]